jgi:hypothetical protein
MYQLRNCDLLSYQELCERPEHDVTSGGPGAMDDCIEKLANVATQVCVHDTCHRAVC